MGPTQLYGFRAQTIPSITPLKCTSASIQALSASTTKEYTDLDHKHIVNCLGGVSDISTFHVAGLIFPDIRSFHRPSTLSKLLVPPRSPRSKDIWCTGRQAPLALSRESDAAQPGQTNYQRHHEMIEAS